MRAAWIVAAALVVGALTAAPARAGVYNTAEPWPLPGNFSQFQLDLAGYRAAAAGTDLQDGQSTGRRYRRQVADLEAKDARGMLSLDDRINLGAYYIRLGEYQKAIRVLEAKSQESRHFMLRANLATAYELAGIPERAISYQQLALSSWPATYPGWDSLQLNFYRKAEQYHLALLQSRQEEARLQPGRGGLRLDPLFPRVNFVGPSGEYEVGTIAPAQWAEVPGDATLVVMQLLLWLPFDDRLHWLLGELLNASGDVIGAAAIIKPILNKPPAPGQDPTKPKWDAGAPPELREHYRLLAAAAKVKENYGQAQTPPLGDAYLNLKLLCALAPRGLGLGAGDLLQEASWPAVVMRTEEVAGRAPEAKRAEGTPAASGSPSTTAAGWLPDWRQLAVGFLAGAVVAWLLGQQFRQGRRAKA